MTLCEVIIYYVFSGRVVTLPSNNFFNHLLFLVATLPIKTIMRINLYISEQTKTQLKKTCEQNKVSMSTLVDILLNRMLHDQFISEEIYYDENKKSQTTIIVNKENKNQLMKTTIHNYSKLLSNMCWAWANWKKVKELEPKAKNDIYSQVVNDLKNRKETYWDYNRQYRNLYRARKQYEREKNHER